MKILMVCLGNVCRSPIAEGILRHKCKQKNLDWHIDSAGTGKWNTAFPPDKRSIDITSRHGIDITSQRARTVRSNDYEEFDLIFAMDVSNYKDLMSWALDKSEENKVKLIMDELSPGENISIPDPYFDNSGFKKVYEMLDKACEKIVERYGK